MSGVKELSSGRTSSRTKKQVQHYGNSVPSDIRRIANANANRSQEKMPSKVNAKAREETRTRINSQDSMSIFSTSSLSAFKKAEVDNETLKVIIQMKTSLRNEQIKLDAMDHEGKQLISEKDKLKEELVNPYLKEETQEAHSSRIKAIDTRLCVLCDEIAASKTKIKYGAEELEDKKALALSEAELKKKAIDLEEEERERLSQQDKMEGVRDWAEKVNAEDPHQDSHSSSEELEGSVVEEEDNSENYETDGENDKHLHHQEKVQHQARAKSPPTGPKSPPRVKRPSVKVKSPQAKKVLHKNGAGKIHRPPPPPHTPPPPTPPPTQRRKKKVERPDSPPTSTQDPLELIAQSQVTLVQTLQALSMQSRSSSNDKLLARQVQGRDLPFFSGKPEEWPAFYSAYMNSTANCGYSDADNLPRLLKCLKGEALTTVQSMLVNPASVSKVVEKLQLRFGQPKLIIENLIRKVKQAPTVKPEQANTYVEFGILVDDLTSTIKSLGSTGYLQNPLLLNDLLEKLPLSNQFDWGRHIDSEPHRDNLEDFAEWLGKITKIAFRLCPPKSVQPQQNENERRHQRPQRRNERVTVVEDVQQDKQQYQRKPRKCHICEKDNHSTRDCKVLEKKTLEERNKIVNEKRLCFGCLNPGHRFSDCRSKKICGVDGCTFKHHPLMHRQQQKKRFPANKAHRKEEDEESSEEKKEDKETIKATVSATHNEDGEVNFLMCPIKIKTSKGLVDGFAVLDNYSSITTIAESTANKFGFSGPVAPLTVSGFNATATHQNSQEVDFTISHFFSQKEFQITGARTVKKMDLHRQSVTKSIVKKWKHLQNLQIALYQEARPTILIGMDHPEFHIQLEVRKSTNPSAPIAVRTALGWMVMGNVGPYKSKNQFTYSLRKADEELHALVKEYFNMESIGTKPNQKPARSQEDARAQAILDSTLNRVSDRWEVGLLWKEDNPKLPSSKDMAMKRLMQMEKRMDRDPEFAKEYCKRIGEYQDKGFARVLSPKEAEEETDKTFYIPHFMAFNPKKKKLRFVFDAAAKSHSKSLNDFLLQGPDKLRSLPGILLNFRLRPIGVTADIKDFFHRVKLNKEDAKSHRFLWRGMERKSAPQVLEMTVLIFGATSSPCCAQEAKNRNAEESKATYPEAYQAIIMKHYMDDYLDSFDNPSEALQMQEEICKIHGNGGFQLCNWLSNSPNVMKLIPEELRATNYKDLDMSDNQTERVLGLFWIPKEDAFTFSLNFIKGNLELEKVPTRREILALCMSIYDPLGFLTILSIKAKMIIQGTWRSGVGWDDPVPEEIIIPWRKWLAELVKIPSFRLPRCYLPSLSKADDVQLHVFCDASLEAHGAVAYLRIQVHGSTEVAFVMSKGKVAPLKERSMPRHELEAALIGTYLADFIKTELEIQIHKTVYWTDNSTVLSWVRSYDKRFQQYVAHRVNEIQVRTEANQWKFVPTADNVADEFTRLSQPCDWSPTSRWLNGPQFLKQEEEFWPPEPVTLKVKEEELEIKRNQIFTASIKKKIPCVIDISRFSSYTRLVRTTAFALRYLNRLHHKDRRDFTPLTLQELRQAECWWWRQVQKDTYPQEVSALKENKKIDKSSKLSKLSAVLDQEGVLRVHGRLENANIPTTTKRPVILEYHHPFTRLLITFYHEICGHHGQERVCNEIRQLYHIPSLRTAVRTAAHTCQKCKNKNAQPHPPEMGQLPDVRLQSHKFPFHHTGLDYFGPLEVVVKRSREKRYVALFTCLSTRAVHLEVAHSLSTDSCLMAIRRFVSRRGSPKSIHSDNGTNFVGVNKELKLALQELDQKKLGESCSSKGIEWFFNPPAAPHMGGSWERMVRAVKVALGDALQLKTLHDESLLTLLVEAEHTVNAHPLTYISDDPDDPEALTPNHFLIGRTSNVQPIGNCDATDLSGRKQWRIVQTMANHFWKRWVQEYLPTLLRREKWFKRTSPIKIGDIVLEVNPNLPRNQWPKGRVTSVYPGKDGIIRVVDIKLSNGHTYKRPVAKLCILDIQQQEAATV